ncbi:holo-ACP synthase [Pontibacillus litoralis]|uniref:Holo-[acyl-carrier-protein] synthase n=1 Tax=Pontibacillus litoralis JSM 072002 TaxID=1385512 RepID=A0A0A5G3G5_9BACI|nr:holo-ACP synthase [Pontibacillus litoralis]KGX86569.1 4'-phosphopantetheinyl transferase [Pontibacillus litoralis JSM 072002]
MIKGIGIDIVEVDRIAAAMKRNKRFINRVLTSSERRLLQSIHNDHRRAEFVAGRFAAKEAFSKAAGTGIGSVYAFQDISIVKNDVGAPILEVDKCSYEIWVSISHSQSHAIAQVVLEEV